MSTSPNIDIEIDHELLRVLARYAEAYTSTTGGSLPDALDDVINLVHTREQEAYKKGYIARGIEEVTNTPQEEGK